VLDSFFQELCSQHGAGLGQHPPPDLDWISPVTQLYVDREKTPIMPEVSTFRLYVLRAMYLLMVLGLAIDIWPLILNHPSDVEHMKGVVRSVLGTVSLLALLGIRYPLKMLPLMFFELIWKTIWILSFGLPLVAAHALTPDTRDTMKACLMGAILFPIVIPWPYVWRHYVKGPADRWRKTAPGPIMR